MMDRADWFGFSLLVFFFEITRTCRNSESAKDDFDVNINFESATESV